MSAAPVPIPNLDDLLRQRGILESAQAAGWQPYRNGWRYPVYNSAGKQHQMIHEGKLEPVYRWKNAMPKPSSSDAWWAKYLWYPAKYEKAKYYLLPDTLTAIKAARGVCYLASGEPDVLAYRAAGIRNVISRITAEIGDPVGLAEDLQIMGVSSLNYYPDRDTAGLKSAAKIKAALADSDVLYMPYTLPFEAAEKHGGDINRLWQQISFDPHRLMSALLDCDSIDDTDLELALADDAPKSTQNRLNFDHTPMDTDKLPRAFKEAIVRDIESLPGFKRWKGSQAEFRCPFHDDTNNSAGFNTDLMAFNCFVCGGMNAKTYGGRRGITLTDYLEHVEPANTMTPAPRLTVLKTDTATASTVASEPRYTDSDTAWAEVRGLVDGTRLPQFAPMEFPFKSLHQFGGMAEMLEPGKVVLLLGASGGAKTTFAESVTEVSQRLGEDIIWYSPEWNPRQMRERSLHRHGGLSLNELRRHKLWLMDKAEGVPEAKRRGALAEDAKVQRTLTLIAQMEAWRGKTYVLNSVLEHSKLTGILETIEGIIQDKREAGRKVSHLVFDYVQRVPGQTSWDKLELAVTAIKGLCERLQIIPWIIAQPTKGDGRNVRNGEDLDDSSIQGLSNQQGNLFLTLNPIFDERGQKYPAIRVKVVKNSEGREGEVILRWSPAYLTIFDQVVNEHGQPL